MNFEFYNPTKVLFGKGNLEKLGEVVKAFGNKALLLTGSGSVKRNGTFDKAVASLKKSNVEIVECDGIEPNPKISSVRKGVKLVKEHKCDVIVALGGGSTMDCSKVIAAGALYDGDP